MPKRSKKISKKEVDKMLYQLCCAISGMKTPEESAEFLQDLFSPQESEMIAKRLKIAEYLNKGVSYNDIKEKLGAGFGTISRVQEWLIISGQGYRKAIERVNKLVKNTKEYSLNRDKDQLSFKKKYPLYYWPEIILENIVQNMNKKQRREIENVIKKLDKAKEKPEIYKRLKNLGL